MDEKYINQIFKHDFNLYYKPNYIQSFQIINIESKFGQYINIEFSNNITYTFDLNNQLIIFTTNIVYNISKFNNWSNIKIYYKPDYTSITKSNNKIIFIYINTNCCYIGYIYSSINKYEKTIHNNKITQTLLNYGNYLTKINIYIIKYNYKNNNIYLFNYTYIYQVYHTFINNSKLTI